VGKNDELNALVNKLVSAENPEEVKEAYATWAENYNNDLNNFGYVAPLIGSELLIKHTSNEESLIHDAGCGTGLVGTLLKEQGYTNLQGSDFSPEMLEKADALQIYGNLVELDFGNPLPQKLLSIRMHSHPKARRLVCMELQRVVPRRSHAASDGVF